MTIAIGDRIPSATLNFLKDGVQAIRSDDLFAGKERVFIVGDGPLHTVPFEMFVTRYTAAAFHKARQGGA